LALAYWVVGIAHVGLGEVERAREAYACAQRIRDDLADPCLQTPALWLAGMLHVIRGEYAESIEACTRARHRRPAEPGAGDGSSGALLSPR